MLTYHRIEIIERFPLILLQDIHHPIAFISVGGIENIIYRRYAKLQSIEGFLQLLASLARYNGVAHIGYFYISNRKSDVGIMPFCSGWRPVLRKRERTEKEGEKEEC